MSKDFSFEKTHFLCTLQYVVAVVMFLVATTVSSFEAFDGKTTFSTLEQFRKYLVEREVASTEGDIYLETLYTLSDDLKVVKALDPGVGMMGGAWPIFLFWESDKGITVEQIDWSPLSSRVAHGELKFIGGKQILGGYKDGEVYALYSRETFFETSELQDENTETQCLENKLLYLVALNYSNKSLEMLTDSPLPVSKGNACDVEAKDDLTVESKNTTFKIEGSDNAAPELRAWVGEYDVQKGELWRSEDVSIIKSRLIQADADAIKYFGKKDIDKAIQVIMPLVDYAPSLLDNDTVSAYNNYAFYLAEKHEYIKSKKLLEKIVSMFPGRVVAQLNLADVCYAMHEYDKAQSYYHSYMRLMTKINKKGKIPNRVWKRIDEH